MTRTDAPHDSSPGPDLDPGGPARSRMRDALGAGGLVGLVIVALAVALAPVALGVGLALLLPDPGTRGGGGPTTWALVALAAALSLVADWVAGLVSKLVAVLLGVRDPRVLRGVAAVAGVLALAVVLQVFVLASVTAALFAALVATALAMVAEPVVDRFLAREPRSAAGTDAV